jgi:phosphonate transport system ATP-binding protein
LEGLRRSARKRGNPTLIEMRQLELRYPNGEIGLASTTLTIRDGEMMVLEGGSGAGKSSCLAIMSGRTRPTAGSLVVNSQNVMAMSKSEQLVANERSCETREPPA